MKITKGILGIMFVVGLLISNSSVASASANANLEAKLTGPSTVDISTPTVYTATVKNFGPNTAPNVKILITMPLTDTSPQVYILGDVTGLDPKCQIVTNKISCNMGELKKNKSASINYTFKAPVSTKLLTMTNSVSSDIPDNNSSNNQASFTPNFIYPSRPIVSGYMNNSHCTGTNLTSYFECLLFPSSISDHFTTLNADFTISFDEPGYTGTWSQPSSNQLHFEYFDGVDKVLEFNGFAINGENCFDGMATFFPNNGYVSPYHVCRPVR